MRGFFELQSARVCGVFFVVGVALLGACEGTSITFPEDEPSAVGPVSEITDDVVVVRDGTHPICGFLRFRGLRAGQIWLRLPDGDVRSVDWTFVTVGASVRAWGQA